MRPRWLPPQSWRSWSGRAHDEGPAAGRRRESRPGATATTASTGTSTSTSRSPSASNEGPAGRTASTRRPSCWPPRSSRCCCPAAASSWGTRWRSVSPASRVPRGPCRFSRDFLPPAHAPDDARRWEAPCCFGSGQPWPSHPQSSPWPRRGPPGLRLATPEAISAGSAWAWLTTSRPSWEKAEPSLGRSSAATPGVGRDGTNRLGLPVRAFLGLCLGRAIYPA